MTLKSLLDKFDYTSRDGLVSLYLWRGTILITEEAISRIPQEYLDEKYQVVKLSLAESIKGDPVLMITVKEKG